MPGLTVAVGNALGALFDLAARAGAPWPPWTALAVLGVACAAALAGLRRTGHRRLAPTTAPAMA